MSIFNPWKAARVAEQEVARLRDILAERDGIEMSVRQELSEVRLRANLAEAHIAKLNRDLDQVHFRNPKTGRIGKKGQRFQ